MYKKDMLQKMKMPGMKRPSPSILEVEVKSDEPSEEMSEEEMMAEGEEGMAKGIDLSSISDDELMAEMSKRGLMK